ncbi:MAG: helix-turn-helix transcriptional regulator [Planctomycetes bacterium]|nr:helix-turn-helix transcriptional regulator [Planctomycetota bacterium]
MTSPQRRSNCPLAFALDLFGDRWSLLVLRDLVFAGKRRFSEFAASPEGIATNVLSDRLRRLEEAGLLRREPDPEDGRKVLYSLTETGFGLTPALCELVLWGLDQQPPGTPGPPAQLVEALRKDRDGAIAALRRKHFG